MFSSVQWAGLKPVMRLKQTRAGRPLASGEHGGQSVSELQRQQIEAAMTLSDNSTPRDASPTHGISDSAVTSVKGHGDAGRIQGGWEGRGLFPSWGGGVQLSIGNSSGVQTTGDGEAGAAGRPGARKRTGRFPLRREGEGPARLCARGPLSLALR